MGCFLFHFVVHYTVFYFFLRIYSVLFCSCVFHSFLFRLCWFQIYVMCLDLFCFFSPILIYSTLVHSVSVVTSICLFSLIQSTNMNHYSIMLGIFWGVCLYILFIYYLYLFLFNPAIIVIVSQLTDVIKRSLWSSFNRIWNILLQCR